MEKSKNVDIIVLAKWKRKEYNMNKIEHMERALKNIDAIVDAYNKGTLIITEQNGYHENGYGLDVIMAIIRNWVIEGTQSTIKRQGGHLYV